MDKKDCYISNNSQGLHVNLSLVNKNTNKPIPLLREFFKSDFFKSYIDWEKNAYLKYRSKESDYAKPLYSFVKEETYNNNYAKILDTKYVSLHRKEGELIEVRLFASNNNYKELISRSEEAIGLLYSSYERWYNSMKPSIYSNRNITRKKKPFNSTKSVTQMPGIPHKGTTKALKTKRRNQRREYGKQNREFN